MKIDKYICDFCGCDIQNGREYKITVKYPIPASVKTPTRYDRSNRKSKTIDLCTSCKIQLLGKVVKV